MVAIARGRARSSNVAFAQADVFGWRPAEHFLVGVAEPTA
jgi:hypothetical protein